MNYTGHYVYNLLSVSLFAPNSKGIYYCGYINDRNELQPMYVGRAIGEGVTIKSRLLDHLKNDRWLGVTHFGYAIQTNNFLTEALEAIEIVRFKPIYNTKGKTV